MVNEDSVYEVLAVRYGSRQTTKAKTYLNYHVYGEADAEMVMDYYCWVIRNRCRTILVDCGFRPHVASRRGRTTLCPPVDALRRVGVDVDGLDGLVVTHAHYDHIGNLDQFPHAQLVASRREVEFWFGPLGRRAQFASSTEHDEIEQLRKAGSEGRLTLFSKNRTVAPGIELVDVGGHTPGQSIVLVDTREGRAVLASDALHYYEEYERDWPFSVVADLGDVYRAFDLLREITSDPGRVLVAGHDPDVMRRFPSAGPDLDDLAVRIG